MQADQKEFNSKILSNYKKLQTFIISNKIGFKVSYFILSIALIIGFGTRLIAIFNYTQFQWDQARDATVMAKMSAGQWPTLGPSSSVGHYSIPPMYYYLSFIFTLGSKDPVAFAISNALFSFLSIPLLVYFILLLTNGFKSARSWLVASFAGLWWSLFFTDILFANVEWNPDSIPFFLLAFLILLKFAIENTVEQINNPETNKIKFNAYFLKSSLLWGSVGFVASILMGLHSSTLFVIPAVLVLVALYLIGYSIWSGLRGDSSSDFKRNLVALTPLISTWIVLIIALAGYIYGEIGRGWLNTQNLFDLIKNPSAQTHTLLERLNRPLFNYLELGDLAYFLNNKVSDIAHFLMYSVLVLSLIKFKGNKLLWACLWLVWGIYSYSISNYWGIIFIHYKALIWFAPIIFTAIYLIYFDAKKFSQSLVAILIILISFYSIQSNAIASKRYISVKFGNQRLVNTKDIIQGLSKLPDGSTVCTIDTWKLSYTYISEQNLPEKNLKIIQDCSTKNIETQIKVHYKYREIEEMKLAENPRPESQNINKIWFENEAVLMYSE